MGKVVLLYRLYRYNHVLSDLSPLPEKIRASEKNADADGTNHAETPLSGLSRCTGSHCSDADLYHPEVSDHVQFSHYPAARGNHILSGRGFQCHAVPLHPEYAGKGTDAQKLQFYEQYEALSLQYQEQAGRVSHEAAKMRHDFNNQDAGVFRLIAANELEDAKQFAAELHSKFQDQALRLHYCENKIANVILQQTAEQCAAQNIRFEVQCSLADRFAHSEDRPLQSVPASAPERHAGSAETSGRNSAVSPQRAAGQGICACIQVQCFAENESRPDRPAQGSGENRQGIHGTAEISCTGNDIQFQYRVFLPENEEASCSTKA